LEVTTPILSAYASCEPTVRNLALSGEFGGRFLRTSPESALKRLLAASSGDVFEIGPAFRADEAGRWHLTEFTLLEWYRVGFDHQRLMDDVEALLRQVGYAGTPQRVAYSALFAELTGDTPEQLDTAQLGSIVSQFPLRLTARDRTDRALLLDAIYAHLLQPRLAIMGAVMLYEFPRELRAYAKLSASRSEVAERFELIIDGIEIANGYHEITDVDEQQRCFADENVTRCARGLATVAADSDWLAALRQGVPAVAGVALGIERLLAILEGCQDLQEVTAFATR